MQILFIDESGDHNLLAIDPQYPLFVLAGVIVNKEYAESELVNKMNTFKQKVFGTTDIVLHTVEISRNQNKFACLKDKDCRMFFYQELNYLMRQLQYTVVACVIHKDHHLSRYGTAAVDPYLFSLNILLECFGFDIGDHGKGLIVAEKRGYILDQKLKLAWENLKLQGTSHLSAKDINNRITDFCLKDKKENIAGLQLADLVVSPIGRHILGKSEKEDFNIIRQKFRTNNKGIYEGYGLIVLPKYSV